MNGALRARINQAKKNTKLGKSLRKRTRQIRRGHRSSG